MNRSNNGLQSNIKIYPPVFIKDFSSITSYNTANKNFVRAKLEILNSSNGDTAEMHDQFYRDHKLLLILFRVLAVMPILRSSPGRITFSWRSGATKYAICFWCLMTIVVIKIGYERLQILYITTKFDEYIYAILFIIFLVPHFWIPFVGWGVAKEVAVYKTMWGSFQVRYFRITGTSLQFPKLKSVIVKISIGCLLCAILFLLSLSVLLDGYPLWHTLAYYHIITMINMNCALWYINSRAIKEAALGLAARFKKDVERQCTSFTISQYRLLWLNLSELLQSLGNAYARTYSTYCLFMLVNITVAIYGALSGIIDHGFVISFKELGLIVDAIYCLTLLFIFCNCSHKATLKVAHDVQDILLSINLNNIDKQAQKEIDLFIVAIEMNPANVSLKGYAYVNHELLTSFYRDHKLLLKLFQILGVMPIVRSGPGLVTFKWKSSAMIYAFIVYSILSIIVLIVGYERFKILQTTKEFDEYIYAVIFLLFLVPHFWIPFVGWGVASEVAKYKTMWAHFQVRYYRVTGTTLQFPNLEILITALFIGCLLCAVIFLISLYYLLDGFLLWHTTAYYQIIVMINMNCSLWYINTKGIKIASKSLSERFKHDINIECSTYTLTQYRFLWLNLSEILQLLGNAYARTYSTYCLFMFINITIAVYGALSEIIDHGISLKVSGLFVAAVYCAILLYIFCDCSHKATLEVAQGVQDTLLSINLLNIDIQTQKEVDIFIQAIEMNPAVVSLRGFANVNRELLTSSVSTIAIYLIVLLQFKLSLIAQKEDEIVTK